MIMESQGPSGKKRSFKMKRSPEEPIDVVPTVVLQPSAINSFTADSPYYQTYVENEMNDMSTVKEILSDVAEKAAIFCQRSNGMIESMQELAEACRLKPSSLPEVEGEKDIERRQREHLIMTERRDCISDESRLVLKNIGRLLDELVDSQKLICDSLNMSLNGTVDRLSSSDAFELEELKTLADATTLQAETALDNYLRDEKIQTNHGNRKGGPWRQLSWRRSDDNAELGSSNHSRRSSVQNTRRSMGFRTADVARRTDSMRSTDYSRRASCQGYNGHHTEAKSSKPHQDAAVESSTRQRSSVRFSLALKSLDRSKDQNTQDELQASADSLQGTGMVKHKQASAELRRFQLFRRLKTVKEQCDFELNEAFLKSSKQIHSQLVVLSSQMASRETKMEELQRRARLKHNTHSLTWEDRETGLLHIIKEVEEDCQLSTVPVANGQLKNVVHFVADDDDDYAEDVPEEESLWSLPGRLAVVSRYQRESAPTLAMEGWLYAEGTGKGGGVVKRQRRWYMLDKDSFSYFKSSKWPKENGKFQSTLKRVKVCNMGACALLEQKADARRYVFQLISPDNSNIVLQARGPNDYRLWLTCIQEAIDEKLGNPSTSVHMRIRNELDMISDSSSSPKHAYRDAESEESSKLGSDAQGSMEDLNANQVCVECGAEQAGSTCSQCTRTIRTGRQSVEQLVLQSRHLLRTLSPMAGVVDNEVAHGASLNSHELTMTNHTHELLP